LLLKVQRVDGDAEPRELGEPQQPHAIVAIGQHQAFVALVAEWRMLPKERQTVSEVVEVVDAKGVMSNAR